MRLFRARLRAVLAAGAVLACAPAGAQVETNSPLYMLTYDHGGVILWGADHFGERLRNAISWLDRYPGFKIGLENEAYVYDYLAEHDPALLDELRGYLKKYRGRLGIGTCTYGQPLTQFINEESNIRQIAYAIKTDQKLLGYTPLIYLMSEHAMHSQIPQILAGFGFQGAIMRTHFMMYGYNPTFDVPIGWWVGLEGSRIPAVPTYPGEGAAFFKTTVDNWFLTRYPGSDAKQSPADFRKQFGHIHPLLATRADDSGLRKEALVKEYASNAEYRWVLLDELSSVFPKPTSDMKTLPDDFTVRMPWGYCGNEIWNLSRRAEVQVLTAERLAALESLLQGTNREPELERAWKSLLVGQHHDIQICGLLPDARSFLSTSIAASTNVLNGSLRFVASQMKSNGLAQVTVFNPLSWQRREWIEADMTLPRGGEGSFAVQHAGQTVPSTVLRSERSTAGMQVRMGFVADVPPLAVESYAIVAAREPPTPPPSQVTVDSENLRIITPFIEAQLAPGGGIASLVDKRTGTVLIAPGKRSGFFAGGINGKDCESHGRWTLHLASEGRPWAVAREYGFIGDIPFNLEIRFPADDARLDCRATFQFSGERIGKVSDDRRDAWAGFVHEDKLRFKVFSGLGTGAIGVRDLPFAIAETTNRYVEGNYWTAVAGTNKGLAFFNRGTMGAVREADGGFSLPLTYATYYIWGTRMLEGEFTYEFAWYPFTGEWRKAGLHRRAIAYNFPVVAASGQPGAGNIADSLQPLDVGSGEVVLSALYPEGSNVYARFYEYQGQTTETVFAYRNRKAELSTTDLLGRAGQPVSGPITFRPWQFRTVRLSPARESP